MLTPVAVSALSVVVGPPVLVGVRQIPPPSCMLVDGIAHMYKQIPLVVVTVLMEVVKPPVQLHHSLVVELPLVVTYSVEKPQE